MPRSPAHGMPAIRSTRWFRELTNGFGGGVLALFIIGWQSNPITTRRRTNNLYLSLEREGPFILFFYGRPGQAGSSLRGVTFFVDRLAE